LGAYTAITQILAVEDLIDTLPDALPSYRTQHIASNSRALRAGAEAVAEAGMTRLAWPAMAGQTPLPKTRATRATRS
jgi:hypothetical protein